MMPKFSRIPVLSEHIGWDQNAKISHTNFLMCLWVVYKIMARKQNINWNLSQSLVNLIKKLQI